MKKILILLSFLAGSIHAQQYQLTDSLPFNPEIRSGQLANGLRYFIRVNNKPEKRAAFRLVVKAGSVLEEDDQQGLAHFVEHMAFNGTKNFPKQELVNYLERTGVEFGPHLNAYTSFDETVYMLQVPTDSQEVFNKAFNVLEDWAGSLSFDPDEFKKERGVVIEEWRLGKGAFERVEDIHNPKIFYDSRYAVRLPIGKKIVLDTAHVDVLKRFYRDWYRPDLMSVIVVGDVKPDEVEKRIIAHFSGLKNPAKERQRTDYLLPDHKHTLISVASDKELPYPSINVLYKRNLTDEKTVGDYRKSLVQRLYSAMLSARLDERTQKSNPPFVYAGAGNFPFVGGKQAFGLFAILREDAMMPGLEALLEEARRVKQHGFTQAELDRQKASVLRFYEKALNERDKTESASYADELVRHVVDNEAVPGIVVEHSIANEFIPGISLDEVNALTDVFIHHDNRVVTVSLPDKKGVEAPDSAQIVAVLDKTDAVEAYTEEMSDLPLATFPEKAGSIAKTKIFDKLGVTEWTLSNGARVVFKPTDFKNDEVVFRAFSFGGSSLVTDNADISASFASQLVTASGLGNYDAIGLDKFLAGKVVRLTPYIAETTEGFVGNASPKDLELLFEMIYAYFTAPRQDDEAIDAHLTKTRSFLQNWKASPENAFNDTVGTTLAQYHPRRRPMTPRTIDEVNADSSLRIFKERFADASDFTFFFVGNIDPDAFKSYCQHYLATLPATRSKEKYRDLKIRFPEGQVSKVVTRGVEPKSIVQLVFTGPYKDSYKNRVDFLLMKDVLDIKLREVLREEKGGVYNVQVNGGPSFFPVPQYSLGIGFGCDPERVDELIGECMIQIDSLKNFPLPSVYVEKVKALQTRNRETNMKENSWWLSILQQSYLTQTDPQTLLDFTDVLKKWSGADFQKSVRKYFGKNLVRVVLKPESSK